ncbi:MAG: glycosyltransferase family 2 protein [Patescibacteria group bacterium]
MQKISVVIPAFNEEERVGAVVRGVLGHPLLTEVIVVDDGSTDRTAERAREAGASVIRLPENQGKGGAMSAGVEVSTGSILLFLDADIAGYTYENISRIIEPVVTEEYDMYVGILARKVLWLNRILHIFPILSGTRAVTRDLWFSVPAEYKHRFQIEIALNYFSKYTKRGAGLELITGLKQVPKEKKHGLLLGLCRRIGMIGHILSIAIRLYIIRSFVSFFILERKVG